MKCVLIMPTHGTTVGWLDATVRLMVFLRQRRRRQAIIADSANAEVVSSLLPPK
jgi:hypothetical protein